MKKFIAWSLLCMLGGVPAGAQETDAKAPAAKETKSDVKEASIVFDKTTQDLGTFSEDDPIVKCTFTFTNEGNAPLVIHQAIASCGCTVPEYPKEPIKPGESGEITVTYNGAGKFPGKFQKTITLRTNGKVEITRLVVKGDMMPAAADAK